MNENNLQDIINITELEVNHQKHNLVNDLEELEDTQETNKFLESIMLDYKRYQETLLREKRRQQALLLNILDYLDQLLETQAITKYTLAHAENEQQRLIHEIKSLQNDMDAILATV